MGALRRSWLMYWVVAVVSESIMVAQTRSESTCDIDLENTLRKLLTDDQPSIQVRVLRKELLRKIIDELEDAEEATLKRNLASLASSNNLPYHKRNLESLARAGYIKTLPDEEDADNSKRSDGYLDQTGQIQDNREEKRGIQSLARNGELHAPKKNLENLLDDLYDKRNIGSLARNFELPGKRSLSSLARSGDLNFMRVQRNIASLARDGKVKGKREAKPDDFLTGAHKRDSNENKGIYKDQKTSRIKREVDYYYSNDEFASPVYQGQNIYDYDDLVQDWNDVFTEQDKRFLGSVARSGWFRPSSSSSRYSSRFVSPEKRHIGALARLGWLPSFRQIRRFNRSGRSTSSDDICRETTSDGEDQVNSDTENASVPVESYRYNYPRPPFVTSFFFHPRSH